MFKLLQEWYPQILVGAFAIAWFVGGLFWRTTMPKRNVVVYECSLSEISPDFPPEVREACRKMRAQSGRI